MGLLNKLKNVLFEEEEIEVPATEVKEEAPKKEKEVFQKRDAVKMTFDDDDILSDRELFKAEPTFNFPMFDEQEFEQEKQEEVIPVKQEEKPVEIKTRVKTPIIMDMERGRRSITRDVTRDNENNQSRKREVSRNETHTFTPSPVISPVYGVLDKNYKKEDIVLRSEEKKVIDVDSVRKKAFGTLEEDIEKSLITPSRKFYESDLPEEKSLDELLENTAEEIIPVIEEETQHEIPSFNIEEEPIESRREELEVLDRTQTRSLEEKLEDETLENDLFDLIDSMYETREDGE